MFLHYSMMYQHGGGKGDEKRFPFTAFSLFEHRIIASATAAKSKTPDSRGSRNMWNLFESYHVQESSMYECCSRSQCPEQAITNVTAVDTVSHVPRDLHYNLRMHSDTAS